MPRNSGGEPSAKRPKKLLGQVRETIRCKHYSIRTEQAYVSWIRRYVVLNQGRRRRFSNTTPAQTPNPTQVTMLTASPTRQVHGRNSILTTCSPGGSSTARKT
ncbi:MAG: phage integrase N-terminal SAM-like domain-containing protein [Anaerolineae bacterium]|nr:phage integrase N-terminal SAM-like domain-containing protein [Anaerolineae bacterium]